MIYARISSKDKQRLVDAYKANRDYQELASQLGIKRQTAYSIVKRTMTDDWERVERPRGGIRETSQKVNPDMQQKCIEIVEQHPDFTLDQINAELRLQYPTLPVVSRSTIARTLENQLIVCKRLEDAPQERNSDANKQKRWEFAFWLMQDGVSQELIFIDEAGINAWIKRNVGRARRGERAVRIVGGQRGRNLTMTFAVSNMHGTVHHQLRLGGMTCESFKDFLQELCNALPAVFYRRTFLFDNAPAHRRAGEVNLPPNTQVMWLPPYSPFLNIVENAISQWKSALKCRLAEVRHQMDGVDNHQRIAILSQLAEQHARITTAQNASAYFARLQGYLP